MPNVDKPFGLSPIRHLNGNPWNGQTTKFLVEDGYGTTALFIGDAVLISGTAPSDDPSGFFPACVRAGNATANVITGVITSFDPIDAAGIEHIEVYRVNSTSRYVNVCIDPDVVFIIQDDGSAILTGDACTQNANLVNTHSGNTNSGLSGTELDATAPGTTAADQLLIIGVWPDELNALGVNCIWEVIISNHSYRTATGIAGV